MCTASPKGQLADSDVRRHFPSGRLTKASWAAYSAKARATTAASYALVTRATSTAYTGVCRSQRNACCCGGACNACCRGNACSNSSAVHGATRSVAVALAASFSQPMRYPRSLLQLANAPLELHTALLVACCSSNALQQQLRNSSVGQHTFRATSSVACVLLLIERATLWQQQCDSSASQCTFRAARLHLRLVAHQTCYSVVS